MKFDESTREPTEWLITYRYNANEAKCPRVLLIGDSICNGYQEKVRDKLAGKAYVSFIATSRCLTDPYYAEDLARILERDTYEVIHFNNGLHSLKVNEEFWESELCRTLALIKEKASGASVIWATSTPLCDPEMTRKVVTLNAIAARVMQEEKIPINDLFGLMNPMDRSEYWVDTFHYNDAAKQIQADRVALAISQASAAFSEKR